MSNKTRKLYNQKELKRVYDLWRKAIASSGVKLQLNMQQYVKVDVKVTPEGKIDKDNHPCNTPCCVVGGFAAADIGTEIHTRFSGSFQQVNYTDYSKRFLLDNGTPYVDTGYNTISHNAWSYIFGGEHSNNFKAACTRIEYAIEHGVPPKDWMYEGT